MTMDESHWMDGGQTVTKLSLRTLRLTQAYRNTSCTTMFNRQHLLFQLFSRIVPGICDGLNILILGIWLDLPVHVHLGLLLGLHPSNIHDVVVVVVVVLSVVDEKHYSRIEVSNNKLSRISLKLKKREKK